MPRFAPLFCRFFACVLALLCAPALAQEQGAQEPPAAQAEQPAPPPESLQILTTARSITIGGNFSGADFYVAGALDNTDPLLLRQSRYDIIVALEGPEQSATLYQKQRRFGLWVNGASVRFSHVPQFYALASTRELRDIAPPQVLRGLGLGLHYLPMRARARITEEEAEFCKEQLAGLKQRQNLYREDIGSVSFGSARLFSARFHLPDNVPVGQYSIKAYLFKDGAYSAEAEAGLDIARRNLAYSLYRAAHIHAFWYGLAAVLIAVFIGIAGRAVFPK